MRKNIDDRFHITKEGDLYKVESLVRDAVDEEFLVTITAQLKAKKSYMEQQLEQIPKQIEALTEQTDKLIPMEIKSLEKKLEVLGPVVKEILDKKEAAKTAENPPTNIEVPKPETSG